MDDIIYGRNPVIEALKAERPINKILLQHGTTRAGDILNLARQRKITVQEADKRSLDKLVQGNHQGVIALVAMKAYADIDDILKTAQEKGEDPFILLLDELEDPHNLGAIIRTADAVGIHGVVIPRRRAVGITPAVVKASAGAVEYVSVCRVTNLAQTIEYLKEKGCWVVGADAAAPQNLWQADLQGPLALVIGSEGKGISRLVREKCDFLVRLPMQGKIGSLNASVAAAVLCYEVLRQRQMGER
ncbi:23S rRNA (guanosine(2251)-2'-O)-methyltransferase RlmB [Thermincola ferriacetica]